LRLLNSGYLRGSGSIDFPAGVEMNGGRLRGEPTLNVPYDVTTKGNCLIEGEVHAPSVHVASNELIVAGTLQGNLVLDYQARLAGTGAINGNVNFGGGQTTEVPDSNGQYGDGDSYLSSDGVLTINGQLLCAYDTFSHHHNFKVTVPHGTISVDGATGVSGATLILQSGTQLQGAGSLSVSRGVRNWIEPPPPWPPEEYEETLDASLVVDGILDKTTQIHTANLSGTGTITKNVTMDSVIGGSCIISSTGTLTLQGELNTQGTVGISSGTLSVAGTTNVAGGELIVGAGATLTGPGLLELNGGMLGGNGLVQKNVKVNQGPSTLFGLVGGGLILGGDADVDAEQGFNCFGNLDNYGTNAIKGTITIDGDVQVVAGALSIKDNSQLAAKSNVSVPPATQMSVGSGCNVSVSGDLVAAGSLAIGVNSSMTVSGTMQVVNTLSVGNSTTIVAGNIFLPGEISAAGGGGGGGGKVTCSGTTSGNGQSKTQFVMESVKSVLKPGWSPGKLTFAHASSEALTLGAKPNSADPNYIVEILNPEGIAGNANGWDLVNVPNGGVTLKNDLGNNFVVQVESLMPDDTQGALANFNATMDYQWRILSTQLGFFGVPLNQLQFVVNDAQFAAANGIPQGRVNLVQDTPASLALRYISPSPHWSLDGNGDWSQAGNWTNGLPNGVDAKPVFGFAITAPRTVTVDAPVVAGQINFASDRSYTLVGTAPLTLDVSQGNALLAVTAGQHAITAPLALNDDLIVSTSAGTSLTISGDLSGVGMSLTKNGEGELLLSGLMAYDGDTTVNAGTLTVGSLIHSPNVTVHGTLNAASLVCDTLTIGVPPANLLAVPVPEPSVFAMLGILGVCLGGFVWRKRRRARI
jgi:autotransporter-associated beta strand protein